MNLRAIVVDDSIIFRKVVRDCLADLPGVEVIDVARDGIAAVEKVRRHRPDLVTLDLEMPGLDGLQVLEQLNAEGIEANVIMVSSHTQRGAISTTKALEIGAFDFIVKPNHEDAAQNERQLKQEIGLRIAALRKRRVAKQQAHCGSTDEPQSNAKSNASDSKSQTNEALSPQSPARGSRVRTDLEAICIGISTGGPKALSKLVPRLSSDLEIPILIVQHMPPLFTQTMAKGLDQQTGLNVIEAANGIALKGGTIYVAPGGKQMRVGGYPGAWTTEITDDDAVRNCKPSVDYLFESAARQFRDRMLAIVMTGMGDDGLAGSRAVASRGGTIWAQDQATSTVYGMPRAVVDAGLAHEIRSLSELSAGINLCAKSSAIACT